MPLHFVPAWVLFAALTADLAPVKLPALVVSEGLSGSVASTACGRPSASKPRLLTLAAEHAIWPNALHIDAGNLLGASALGTLAVAHDLPGLIQTLPSMQLRALALGRRDLATDRPTLLRAARGLSEAGLPFLLTNARCDGKGRPLCDAVVDANDTPWMVDSASGKVAILSVLSPAVLASVAPDRALGLKLDDPAATLARMEGAPDALIASHVSQQLSSAVAPPPSRMVLIATQPGHAFQLLPTFESPTDTATLPPPADVVEWSEGMGRWVCAAYAGPGSQWPLANALDEGVFAQRLLDVLRVQTHAEVAVLNRRAIEDVFPIRKKLTRLDLIPALSFDNAIEVARIPGAQLKKLVVADQAQKNLYVRGAAVSADGKVTVNGRPLDETQTYRVVTNDYLAQGGEGGLADKAVRFRPVGKLTIREAYLDGLQRAGPKGLLPGASSATDPARKTRWVFRSALDLGFSLVRVTNPALTVFTDTQLSRSNSIAFRGTLEARADADHPDYTLENGLTLRYGSAQTAKPQGTRTGLVETEDLLFLRDTATLRRYGNSTARWYIPVPFAESYLESEFNRPATRPYHHLEWRPVAGVRLPLLPELALYAGAGLDWETLARPGEMASGEPVAAGVVVGGALSRPKRLLTQGLLSVDAEGSLDVSWRDPTG